MSMHRLGELGFYLYMAVADKLLYLGIAEQVFGIGHGVLLVGWGVGKDMPPSYVFKGIHLGGGHCCMLLTL